MLRILMLGALMGAGSLVGASAALAQAATQDINITAVVPKFCTVGGSFTPAAINTTFTISSSGAVTTTTQNFPIASVVCNTATDVVATSQSGGVRSATAAASGFTNIINYTGVATLGTAVSTINTATVPAAAAAEAGNTAATAGAVSGSLVVDITPASPALPLMAATDYADTLRITLTPQ